MLEILVSSLWLNSIDLRTYQEVIPIVLIMSNNLTLKSMQRKYPKGHKMEILPHTR